MASLESLPRDPISKRSKPQLKFTTYLTRLFKRHNSAFGLTAQAAECMDILIKITIGKIIQNMNMLLTVVDKKTISHRDIHHAIRLTFKESLFDSSTTYASNAVRTYKTKAASSPSHISTRSEKAGLVLPVTRIEKIFMDNLKKPKRKTDTVAVYLVGAIENVVLELYRGADYEVAKVKKHRLTPLYITRAIHNNPALSELYHDCILMHDPIHPVSRKSRKKRKPKPQPRPQVLVLETQSSRSGKIKSKKKRGKTKPKKSAAKTFK